MENNNTNIMCVETVENYIIAAIGAIEEITAKTPMECKAVWDATEYLKLFQKTQGMALREAFE